MTRHLRLLLAAVALPVLCGWSSCQQSLNTDPSFDLWCGQSLCNWRTDSGAVQRVSTWNPDDYGVQLVGTDAQISQLVTETGTQTPQCLRFEMMTDIEDTADLMLSLDFNDDGNIDFQAPVPATNWQPVSFQVGAPIYFASVRFILHKRGSGRAVLAALRITASADCTGSISLTNQQDAAPCRGDGECKNGHCGQAVFPYDTGVDLACGECTTDADCTPGQVCGVGIASLGMHPACVAPAAKLGERCIENGDCASGACCDQVCSSCCGGSGCTGSDACAKTPDPSNGELLWISRPSICAPGQGHGSTGAACLANADCSSGTCAGSGQLKVCWFDGRRCQTDTDCPTQSQDATGKVASCWSLGVDQGRCQ